MVKMGINVKIAFWQKQIEVKPLTVGYLIFRSILNYKLKQWFGFAIFFFLTALYGFLELKNLILLQILSSQSVETEIFWSLYITLKKVATGTAKKEKPLPSIYLFEVSKTFIEVNPLTFKNIKTHTSTIFFTTDAIQPFKYCPLKLKVFVTNGLSRFERHTKDNSRPGVVVLPMPNSTVSSLWWMQRRRMLPYTMFLLWWTS